MGNPNTNTAPTTTVAASQIQQPTDNTCPCLPLPYSHTPNKQPLHEPLSYPTATSHSPPPHGSAIPTAPLHFVQPSHHPAHSASAAPAGSTTLHPAVNKQSIAYIKKTRTIVQEAYCRQVYHMCPCIITVPLSGTRWVATSSAPRASVPFLFHTTTWPSYAAVPFSMMCQKQCTKPLHFFCETVNCL